MSYSYQIPTRLFFGPLAEHAREFAGYGQKALLITGQSSIKNGARADVCAILDAAGVQTLVFDRVEENPSVETVAAAAAAGFAFGGEFVVALGGGSPLDAAKAVALLLKQAPPADADAALFEPNMHPNGAAPILAIPTTAGTGSEVTPYAVLTRHSRRTKASIPYRLYPAKAFIDPAYTATLPERVTLNTAIDALCHLAEGYLSGGATRLTDAMAEGGLSGFASLREALSARRFDAPLRESLLTLSTLAGLVIAQTKTSLPHQLGYALTYNHGIPHGAACGLLLPGYVRFHQNTKKADRVLGLLGFTDTGALRAWLCGILDCKLTLTAAEIDTYTRALCDSPERLRTHPYPVAPDDVAALYQSATTKPPLLA